MDDRRAMRLPNPVDASRSSFALIQKRLACLHAGMR
jgi:hypothetical protein